MFNVYFIIVCNMFLNIFLQLATHEVVEVCGKILYQVTIMITTTIMTHDT